MKIALQRIKKLYSQLRGLFPSRVPVGVAEFEKWADSIISTYSMPTKNRDSILFSLSTMVMHLGPKDAYKAKYYFALMLNASAAKQVAGHVFQEVKLRQRQAEEAAKAKQLEATESSELSVVPKQ